MVRPTTTRRWAALLLLLTLAGCALASAPEAATPQAAVAPEAPQPAGDALVTISFPAQDYDRPVYQELARSFSAENPGIKVVIIRQEDLFFSLDDRFGSRDRTVSFLDVLRRGVSGADTLPASMVAPEAFGTNLLYNLAPLIEADPAFQRDDFYPGALERYTLKGGTWVLPRSFSIPLLSYNKGLFERSGVAVPKPGWTWADLLATAQQLARANGTTIETYGVHGEDVRLLLADLASRKPDLFTTPIDRVHLDAPEVVAALERLRAHHRSGAVFALGERPPGEILPPDAGQFVRDERIGIWGPNLLPDAPYPAPGAPAFSVGTLPYPLLDPPLSALNPQASEWMDGYVISSGTAHPNEAWRWIEYLSRQQIDRVMPGSMPARKSVAEASGFWSTMDAERAAAYQWSLEHTPPLSRSEAPDNLTMIADALAQAHVVLHRDPKADLAKALKDAQREVWDRVALSRLTPTAQPDLGPVMVATPPRQEAPEGAVTIRFLAPSNNLASLRRLTYTFSEQHPDIFVELPSTTSLGGSERLSDYARGGDCFWWYEAPRSDADFAALLDLRPLIDADPSFPRDDIPAALYSAYERNGGLYGLPFAFSLRSLGFNRTALDAAGLEPPTADWTPEDFLRAAQALTKGEGDQKQYGYVPVSSSASDLFFFIGQFGGQLSTGSGDTIRPNFTDPTVVRAVQWYIDLSNVHRVAPPLVIRHRANQPYDNRSEALIQTGRAGLWFVPSLLDDADRFMMGGSPSEVGVAPLPVGAGGLRGGDLRVVGYHISAASAASQQCWAWISFLSGKLNIVPEIIIPARQSLALSEDYTKIAPPPLLDLYRAYGDALKRPSRPSVTSEFYQRFDLYWFFKAISAASEQDKDLDAELTEAQRLTTAYLECMVKERQQKPATCARSADPGYQGFASQDRVP